MKSKKRVNNKQEARQRMRIKAILRYGAVTLVLLIVGLTAFFQLTQTKKMKAIDDPSTWVIVNEPEYVTETSLPQVIITHEAAGPNTHQYRKVLPTAGQ